ncbi:MAG: FAD binding domain-containing protein [Deltaproteobacteria bacterium]|nr:FAD binding domain-containing protein [Deltaproteobacteria bacterium]
MALWERYYTVTNLDEAVRLLDEHKKAARIVAGGTDLMIELGRKARQTPVLIDITRVPGTDGIALGDDGLLHLGPNVTHAQASASALVQEKGLPLAQACWQVGAPAIRNRATVAGNLATASPANDTITALRALDAALVLRSVRGERIVPVEDCYKGVRRTVIEPDELIVDIRFSPLGPRHRATYLKLGLRRVLAIAVVNVAVVLELDDEDKVAHARIATGCVAPTIVCAPDAELALTGHALTDEKIDEAADSTAASISPIDDLRGAAWFRRDEVRALLRRGLRALRDGDPRFGLPTAAKMIRLSTETSKTDPVLDEQVLHETTGEQPIVFTVNGERKEVQGANGKSLLHMLRDDLGLTGTKVGCEEGECGACTVWLDGRAVLACLTPAPRAHGAEVTTIEGLAKGDEMHPVQQAFVDVDAVQCGYCTPGFVMSAAKLLEERKNPDTAQIRQAVSGNLCRCTGYYKIVEAVEKAARELGKEV